MARPPKAVQDSKPAAQKATPSAKVNSVGRSVGRPPKNAKPTATNLIQPKSLPASKKTAVAPPSAKMKPTAPTPAPSTALATKAKKATSSVAADTQKSTEHATKSTPSSTKAGKQAAEATPSTKSEKSDDKKKKASITPTVRSHSVEELIKTPYVSPTGTSVSGATVKLNLKKKFESADDAVHAVFVTQDVFGNETAIDDVAADDGDDGDDGESTKSSSKGKISMDVAKLKSVYNIDWKAHQSLFRAQGFSAAAGSTANIVNTDGTPLVVIGLGKMDQKEKAISSGSFRTAMAAATRAARKLRLPHLQLQLPDVPVLTVDHRTPTGFGFGVKNIKQSETQMMDFEARVTQSMRQVITNNYSFDKYLKQSTVRNKHFKLNQISIVDKDGRVTPQLAHNSIHRAESENLAKEIGSLRSNTATSIYMKEQCEALVKAHPDVLKIKILDKAELEKQGHTLLLGVNQGSVLPPYLVSIEYTPLKAADKVKSEKPIVYIGKTLTFDTGGYDLKPPSSMETMYTDKHGGCNTLSLMRTLALTRPATSRKVVGILTITDNQIGPLATHPNDVFETPKGSVAVLNTDAEGRLALADAITFAQREYKPARITTMATLTGAILVALGHNTGLFTNHRKLAREIIDTADKNGEVIWNMPILKSNHTQLQGKEVDLNNISKGRNMGSSTAAAFLEHFVERDVSFVHLDIAGASTDSNDVVTGATVSSLQDIIMKH